MHATVGTSGPLAIKKQDSLLYICVDVCGTLHRSPTEHVEVGIVDMIPLSSMSFSYLCDGTPEEGEGKSEAEMG